MIAPPPGEDHDGHYGNVMIYDGSLSAMDCYTCGYRHLTPIPSQADLDAYYDEVYQKGECLLEQDAGQQWYWNLVYEARMREFERLTLGHDLLDYGCGVGWFVRFVRERNRLNMKRPTRYWYAIGYEPNAHAGTHSPYFIGRDDLPAYDWDGMFDAVNCSLVLEHVRDPLEELRYIHASLTPGGIACIIVPNEFNPLQMRLIYDRGYSPLHETHVNYFTPASLENLAVRAGFEVVRRTATFPIEWFALHGLDYVRHPGLGATAHRLRMWFDAFLLKFAPVVLEQMRDCWAEAGIGREIELWVKRS